MTRRYVYGIVGLLLCMIGAALPGYNYAFGWHADGWLHIITPACTGIGFAFVWMLIPLPPPAAPPLPQHDEPPHNAGDAPKVDPAR